MIEPQLDDDRPAGASDATVRQFAALCGVALGAAAVRDIWFRGAAGRGEMLAALALAVVVVGGISLIGGRGAILFSIIPGAFIFEMIRNGLTNLGADPYSYRLIGGAVIFAAMYADALKSGRYAMRRRL